MFAPIRTDRLELVPATVESSRSELRGEEAFEHHVQARLAPGWPPDLYGEEATQYTLDKLKSAPDQAGWWMRYIVRRDEHGKRLVIGTCGYKGPPDPEGQVEIGYGLVSEEQGKGFATEAARGLIQHAFANGMVEWVVAQTLTDHYSSIAVMERCGLRYLGDGDEAGVVRYGMPRGP